MVKHKRVVNPAARRRTHDGGKSTEWFGWPAGILTIALVTTVQCLVGTMGGAESVWRMDRPYYPDYWYYAGLSQALLANFPPRNPAFAGHLLSQYSFHLAPLALLSLVVSPFLAMRLLNVVYAGFLLLLLRRYLPRSFGLAGVCVLLTAPLYYHVNPLAIDLLTRGFYHMPFVLLAVVAVLETSRPTLRAAAMFLLPWAHGLMALSFTPMAAYVSRSQWKRYWPMLLGGFLSAGAGVWVISGGESGGELWRSLGWRPVEPLLHLFPLVIALYFVRRPVWWIGVTTGLVMAAVIGWNRFYFLFGLNFALSMAAAEAVLNGSRTKRLTATVCIAAAVLAGVIGGYRQLHAHAPYDRRPVAAALAWVKSNTPPTAVFLQAPMPPALLENDAANRRSGFGYWLLEARPLFVAYPQWATNLGLPGIPRAMEAIAYFLGEAAVPRGVEYVFYGPMERAWFPRFSPPDATTVYRDEHVVIFKATQARS